MAVSVRFGGILSRGKTVLIRGKEEIILAPILAQEKRKQFGVERARGNVLDTAKSWLLYGALAWRFGNLVCYYWFLDLYYTRIVGEQGGKYCGGRSGFCSTALRRNLFFARSVECNITALINLFDRHHNHP